MCVQDIKIGRASVSRTFVRTATAGVIVSALPNNGDRIAVSMVVQSGGSTPFGGVVILGVRVGAGVSALLGVTGNTPFASQTIDRAGTDLTAELALLNDGATDVQVIVTETYFIRGLDDV